MNVSLSTKYSAPQRKPELAKELSLLNPKVQKPLLALQTAMESKTFLKAAEQLIHAAIPCDVGLYAAPLLDGSRALDDGVGLGRRRFHQ